MPRHFSTPLAWRSLGHAGHAPNKSRCGWPRRHARKGVALGYGITLPRAAVPGLRCSTAVFMRMATPLAMNVPDGEPVTDVLCLLVPLPGFSSDRELLASLIKQLGDIRLRGALRQAHNVESIHRLLTDSRQ